MRPCPSYAFVPGRLGHWFALGATSGSSDFAHYSQSHQSHQAVSSLYRGPRLAHQFYGLSVHFQLLSTSPRGDAVTFSFWRKLHQRGTFTLLRISHSQAHECARPRAHSEQLTGAFDLVFSFSVR